MKFKALILTAVILLMTSAVYAAKISPEESMQKFCNAFLHLDEVDLKFLNASAEDFRQQYISGFANNDGDIKFTNEQANRMAEALIEQMRQKVKFSVKTESVKGNKAVVVVTVTGISFNDVLNGIDFDATNLTAEEISELATKEIIDRIKNVPVKDPATVKFNCDYDEESGLWIPEGENNLTPLFDAALN